MMVMAENEPEKTTEKTVIGCMSVQMAAWNPQNITEGSIVKQCDFCGLDVYLSISGQKMYESQPCQLICIPCTMELKKDCDEKGEEIKCDVVPGAFEELKDHIEKEEKDE